MCKILSTFNFNPVRHSILKTSSIQTTDIFFIKYLLCSQTPAKLSIPSFTMAAKTVLSSHKPQTLVIWLGWAGPTDRCNRPNLLQDTEPKKLCHPLLVLNTKVRYRPRKNGRCALMVVLRYRFTLLYIFLSSCTSFSDLFFFYWRRGQTLQGVVDSEPDCGVAGNQHRAGSRNRSFFMVTVKICAHRV